MASVEEPDFMKGPRTPLEGLSSSSEARAMVNQRFPGKPYCSVRDWTIFRIEVTRDELFKCHAAGQLPMILFAHNGKDQYGRFGDGHLIRTSDVVKVEREGRFWVMTTVNSRYVLATFQRDNGRASLRQFLRLSRGQHHLSPHVLQ